MQRVLVMLGVTGPEVDVAAPSQKAKQAQEKIVEKLRPEDCVMAQFMRGIEQEDVKRTVGQQRRQQQIESILHLPSERARENDQSEVPKRLQKPLPVTAPIQLAHLLARQRRFYTTTPFAHSVYFPYSAVSLFLFGSTLMRHPGLEPTL